MVVWGAFNRRLGLLDTVILGAGSFKQPPDTVQKYKLPRNHLTPYNGVIGGRGGGGVGGGWRILRNCIPLRKPHLHYRIAQNRIVILSI